MAASLPKVIFHAISPMVGKPAIAAAMLRTATICAMICVPKKFYCLPLPLVFGDLLDLWSIPDRLSLFERRSPPNRLSLSVIAPSPLIRQAGRHYGQLLNCS